MGKFKFWDYDRKFHIESDEVLQMSATDITMCNECEQKLMFKLTGAPKPRKNSYLVMGSVFHSVIEQDLRYKVKRGVNLKQDELEKIFTGEWEKAKVGADFTKVPEYNAKIKCQNFIRIYTLKMSPMLYPLNNENIERFFRVYVNFGEKRLGITGKIDLIGRDMWITDHKTSSKAWTQEDANKEVQAYVYPWALKALGVNVLGFKFNVCHGVVVTPFSVPYNQPETKKWLKRAFEIKDALENDNAFGAKQEWVCKWCDYEKGCEKSLLKVKAQEVGEFDLESL